MSENETQLIFRIISDEIAKRDGETRHVLIELQLRIADKIRQYRDSLPKPSASSIIAPDLGFEWNENGPQGPNWYPITDKDGQS